MTANAGRSNSVRIRGMPPSLFTALNLPDAGSGSVTVSFDSPDTTVKNAFAFAPPVAQLSPLNEAGTNRLHLRLPRSIPPGTYEGTVRINAEPRPLIVEVEARKRISIFPRRAEIRAVPGGSTDLYLTLLNMGNVPLEVPRVSGFGIFAKDGVDLAVGRTFQQKTGGQTSRADRFMDALGDGYGGVVKLRVQKGWGRLDPGMSREVALALQVPAQAASGRKYWGLWVLHEYNFKIELDIVAADRKPRKEDTVT
jgi:hypothetical protein